jgi:hypothetical protein
MKVELLAFTQANPDLSSEGLAEVGDLVTMQRCEDGRLR